MEIFMYSGLAVLDLWNFHLYRYEVRFLLLLHDRFSDGS